MAPFGWDAALLPFAEPCVTAGRFGASPTDLSESQQHYCEYLLCTITIEEVSKHFKQSFLLSNVSLKNWRYQK